MPHEREPRQHAHARTCQNELLGYPDRIGRVALVAARGWPRLAVSRGRTLSPLAAGSFGYRPLSSVGSRTRIWISAPTVAHARCRFRVIDRWLTAERDRAECQTLVTSSRGYPPIAWSTTTLCARGTRMAGRAACPTRMQDMGRRVRPQQVRGRHIPTTESSLPRALRAPRTKPRPLLVLLATRHESRTAYGIVLTSPATGEMKHARTFNAKSHSARRGQIPLDCCLARRVGDLTWSPGGISS